MKALLAIITIWAYAGSIVFRPAEAQQKVFLSFGSSGAYATSLGNLRAEVKGSRTCQLLPMLAGDNKYVLVQLGVTNPITLTIHAKTLYVEGYSDVYQGKCRSFVTDDASSGAGASLCGSGVTATRLGFRGNYAGLLGAAGSGLTRETFEIGIKQLQDRMKVIYGKDKADKKAQAQFMLTAVQVVSEATRFTYIMREVMKWVNFYPNKRMTSLEDEWDKVSRAIGKADKDGNIPAKDQPKDLKNEDGSPRTVTKVSDIRGDIGLLNKVDCNFSKSKFFPVPQLMAAYIVENNLMGDFEGVLS